MKALWYTDGPASRGMEQRLFQNGATGVRLTFSYGTAEYQDERASAIKIAADQVGCTCCVVADLAGEKFRLGTFSTQPTVQVPAGTSIRLIHAESAGLSSEIVLPVRNASFFSYLRKDSVVTVGDGSAVFKITWASEVEAMAEITTSGVINQCRGLNIQDSGFRPRSLTAKDLRDVSHILASDIYDVLALSFVGSDADVLSVRELVRNSGSDIKILAKIETAAGVENIDAICKCADSVMAARGDLAATLPWVELPVAVQEIAAAARANDTPWFLATQIVEGLERFAIPTRAEICDLAHWLNEGCAGVLLSYETAFGARPETAVACASSMLRRYGTSA